MAVSMLIGVMVAVVIAVAIVPTLLSAVNEEVAPVEEVPISTGLPPQGTDTGVVSEFKSEPASGVEGVLVSVLLYVFVIVMILSAVAWLGLSRDRGGGGGISTTLIRLRGRFGVFPNSSGLVHYFRARELEETVEAVARVVGTSLLYMSNVKTASDVGYEPAEFKRGAGELWFDSNFNWYVVEKSADCAMYKVVGLHQNQRGLNCVYLIGRDLHTGTPYVIRCPYEYLKSSMRECVGWSLDMKKGDTLVEV